MRTPIYFLDAKDGISCSQFKSELHSDKMMFRFSIDSNKVISIATNLKGIGLALELGRK
ncbi:MAG TPA: hypothetical protein VLD38_07045 [Nitrosopumilaceae archaeon]|nr:hypothetical protein [Nitrosopumilaceae archaeon]